MATKKTTKKEKKDYPEGLVNVAILNVRKAPSPEAEILKHVFKGDTLPLLGDAGDYWNTPEGYVRKEFIDEQKS